MRLRLKAEPISSKTELSCVFESTFGNAMLFRHAGLPSGHSGFDADKLV